MPIIMQFTFCFSFVSCIYTVWQDETTTCICEIETDLREITCTPSFVFADECPNCGMVGGGEMVDQQGWGVQRKEGMWLPDRD